MPQVNVRVGNNRKVFTLGADREEKFSETKDESVTCMHPDQMHRPNQEAQPGADNHSNRTTHPFPEYVAPLEPMPFA